MSEADAIYLHIPFCLRKCRYCDFCSFPALPKETREAYVSALCAEIAASGGGRGERGIRSVYFGGGTPTLLCAEQVTRIFEALHRTFQIEPDAEITFEMNPGTANPAFLRHLRSAGVNRISIGMQSANDSELAALGRVHNADGFRQSYVMAREAGFRNINVDLMYGIPGQSTETLSATLNFLLALSPEHISAYGLIVEEGTPFYRLRDSLSLPDDDEEYAMYRLICRRLGEAGYVHYEISNYAKPGYSCRHNLTYWHDREYYAFGLSASSFLEGVRKTNTRDLSAYLADPLRAVAESTPIPPDEQEFEVLMLALRLAEGVDETAFAARFGHTFRDKYRETLAPYRKAGYLTFENGRTVLTEEGLYLSSALLTALLP